MKGFTFVVLTYNHEMFVIEHLDSIKRIVELYGGQYDTSLLICDDCSKDDTVKRCKDWISNNIGLFLDVEIKVNNSNMGTVYNLINAIKNVHTEEFKILAGDDMYELFDIYDVYEKIDGRILITRVNRFGNDIEILNSDNDFYFYLLYEMQNKVKMRTLLLIENFFDAPGVFVPGMYLRDEKLFDFLSNYKYIEDYPLWIYLIVYKKNKTIVKDVVYIKYRLGVGVSTNGKNEKRSEYVNEVHAIRRKFRIKKYIYPRYINPYNIWIVYKRFVLSIKFRKPFIKSRLHRRLLF